MPSNAFRRIAALIPRARRTGQETVRRRSRRQALAIEGLDGRTLLSATVFSVNSLNDLGSGSGTAGDLRYCVQQANANTNPDGNLIEFAPLVASGRFTLFNGPLELTNTTGPESIVATPGNNVTISGNNADRVFIVDAGVTASFRGLTITQGYATPKIVDFTVSAGGAGILNLGTLTVSQCSITGNLINLTTQIGAGVDNFGTFTATATTFAYNTANGPAIGGAGLAGISTLPVGQFKGSTSSTTLVDCTVSQNNAGGSLFGAGGAFLDIGSSLNVTNSSFTGNSASNASNLFLVSGGGAIFNQGTLTVKSSSFVGNTADHTEDGGGAIYSAGALTVTDSTFDGNSASNCPAGGGGAIVDFSFGTTTTIVGSTIADNTADHARGGGLFVALGSTDELFDTIVARNTSDGVPSDVYGSLMTGEYNLIGTGGAGGITNGTNGNLVGVANPGLGTVGYYGGVTQTVPLLAGSPAIDAGLGTISSVMIPGIDQRGAQRGPAGLYAGTGVDIGAFEASSSYLVTSAGDDGTLGTLRLGLAFAGTGSNPLAPAGTANVVGFDATPTGPFATPQTLTLSLGPLDLVGNGSSKAFIEGPGATALSITTNNTSRVVTVDSNAIATLSGLTIMGGTDTIIGGGGINNSGTLTLSSVAVTGNTANIANFGSGGGIFNTPTGSLTVLNSTISGNTAIGLGGGGICNNGGIVSIIDSTIAGNSAVSSFYGGGGILSAGTLTLVSTTIADNSINGGALGSTPAGAGLDQILGGTTSIYDTIVARNIDISTGTPASSDITGSVNTASAYDVIGIGGSGGLINGANHSLIGVIDPGLGTLGYNGGLTQTLPLVFGSAAFDTGSATIAGVNVPSLDQRGALRGPAGLGAGAAFDVGAYEASSSALVINATDDAGVGTLRAALAWANGSSNPYALPGTRNTIQFDTGPTGLFTGPQRIVLELGPLVVSNAATPVVIMGPGANLLTVSGGNLTSVLQIDFSGTATVSGLTIADGLSTGLSGGGITNSNTLTLAGCTVIDCMATGPNSAGGGGIFNIGTLTLIDSAVVNNSSELTRGGGGGILNLGTLGVFNTTIAGNSSNNDTDGGGGIADAGPATIVNSTIARNQVVNGLGGGILTDAGTVLLENSIVADNLKTDGSLPFPDDVSGALFGTSSYNLIGTAGTSGLTDGVSGNKVGVDPVLGTLTDNGGPVPTIALLAGSPAIDAGSNALALGPDGNPLQTDARGLGFVRVFNGTVDIGAYELQPAVITALSVSWGKAGTASLFVAADGLRLLPPGRNTDLPWLGINQITITLDQPETLAPGDLSVTGLTVASYGPVMVSGSGFTYVITLAQPINAADRVTVTIANPQIASFTGRIDVLPGDINDDGVVNSQDLVLERNIILGLGAGPTIFGDIDGDGTVDLNDYVLVRKHVGTRLPALT
jgi:hypothetical protein